MSYNLFSATQNFRKGGCLTLDDVFYERFFPCVGLCVGPVGTCLLQWRVPSVWFISMMKAGLETESAPHCAALTLALSCCKQHQRAEQCV